MSKTKINKKAKTARLSILSNTTLIVMKIGAGLYSGSVSIVSEAIHSTLDLVASVIAYFAVRISDKPADKHHPFGHGKYENVSGVIEALLIFAAAIWIIIEALRKLLNSDHLLEVKTLDIGIVVMLLSGFINFLVSRRLYKVSKETGSLALEADALHLKTDIYTSVGVGLGLLAIRLTGFYFLDPVIALLVATFIIHEAYNLLRKAFNPLLDSALSDKEVEGYTDFIKQEMPDFYRYCNLKTRKSGVFSIVQFQLITRADVMLGEAVRQRDILNDKIVKRFPNTELIILLDAE